MIQNKKRVYVDMDGVLVDLEKYVTSKDVHQIISRTTPDQRSDAFENVIKNRALEAFKYADSIIGADLAWLWLSKNFDTYILSTPMWDHTRSWTDKREWVSANLGPSAEKRLILTHNKGLVKGDYLIDDRTKHGVDEFEGEHIHFGQPGFESWFEVMNYLKKKENI